MFLPYLQNADLSWWIQTMPMMKDMVWEWVAVRVIGPKVAFGVVEETPDQSLRK